MKLYLKSEFSHEISFTFILWSWYSMVCWAAGTYLFMQVGDKAVKVKHDIVMKPESAKKQSGFFKSNKSRFPMYPCHEDKIKYDDYGEIIRPEDFMMDTAEPVSRMSLP